MDDASGPVHHVKCAAANVADVTQSHKLLHGQEIRMQWSKVCYRRLAKNAAGGRLPKFRLKRPKRGQIDNSRPL